MVDEVNLEHWKREVVQLAKIKDYSTQEPWLMHGCQKEVHEMNQLIEDWRAGKARLDCIGCKIKKVVDQASRQCLHCRLEYSQQDLIAMFKVELASEFAGSMHFITQLMNEVAPDINLDDAMHVEIQKNYLNKKKTLDKEGNIVQL